MSTETPKNFNPVEYVQFEDGAMPVPARRHVNPDGSMGGWVAITAKVDDTAFINEDACVYGNAQVWDTARVCHASKVYGWAKVSGEARLFGSAHVFGNARVYEKVIIQERAKVHGNAEVSGKAELHDDAQAYGEARLWGEASLHGGSKVFGKAVLCGKENVCSGPSIVSRDAEIYANKHILSGSLRSYWWTYTTSNQVLSFGCTTERIDEWEENLDKICEENGEPYYAPDILNLLDYLKAYTKRHPYPESK